MTPAWGIANQRWRGRRLVWRPDDVIDPRRFEVSETDSDTLVRAFVEEHHYSGTYPAALRRFLLWDLGELVGTAVFSQPSRKAVVRKVWPTWSTAEVFELGRLVLRDRVPGNGESWFVARCFELLRGDVAGVISFSDPVPRRASSGAVVFPGHIGQVYQATNGAYLGRSSPMTIRLFPDGTVLSNEACGKLRQGRTGWRYAAAQLERWGAAPMREGEDGRAYLHRWWHLTTGMRHHGNHRYAWVIDPRSRVARRELSARAQAYPRRAA